MEPINELFQGRSFRKRNLGKSNQVAIALVGKDFFKRVGDAYGAFVIIDVDKVERQHFQWTQILVNSNGRRFLGLLHVMVGSSIYTFQLWLETPPWLSLVFSKEDQRLRMTTSRGHMQKSLTSSILPLHVDQVAIGPAYSSCITNLLAIGPNGGLASETQFLTSNGPMSKAI